MALGELPLVDVREDPEGLELRRSEPQNGLYWCESKSAWKAHPPDYLNAADRCFTVWRMTLRNIKDHRDKMIHQQARALHFAKTGGVLEQSILWVQLPQCSCRGGMDAAVTDDAVLMPNMVDV